MQKNPPKTGNDPLMFTFQRSASEDEPKMRKNKSNSPAPRFYPRSKLSQQPKLPPVSVILPKENITTQWFKDFGSNKDRLKKIPKLSSHILC